MSSRQVSECCTLSSCYRKNILNAPSITKSNKTFRRLKATNSFNKHLSRFDISASETQGIKKRRSADFLWLQENDGKPNWRTGFGYEIYSKFKKLLRYQRGMTIAFCSLQASIRHEEKTTPWMMENFWPQKKSKKFSPILCKNIRWLLWAGFIISDGSERMKRFICHQPSPPTH